MYNRWNDIASECGPYCPFEPSSLINDSDSPRATFKETIYDRVIIPFRTIPIKLNTKRLDLLRRTDQFRSILATYVWYFSARQIEHSKPLGARTTTYEPTLGSQKELHVNACENVMQ